MELCIVSHHHIIVQITHIFFYSHRMTLWIKCFDLYFHSFCHRSLSLRHSAWATTAFMICLHCLTNSILACQLKWSVPNSCYLYLHMTTNKWYILSTTTTNMNWQSSWDSTTEAHNLKCIIFKRIKKEKILNRQTGLNVIIFLTWEFQYRLKKTAITNIARTGRNKSLEYRD